MRQVLRMFALSLDIATPQAGRYTALMTQGRSSILHIVHNYTAPGGIQEHVRDLICGGDAEFSHFILSPDSGFITLYDSENRVLRRYPGAEIEYPVAPISSPPYDGALLTVLDELKPSLIQIHHLSGWPLGMIGLIAECGRPWTITVHDYVYITPHGGMIGAHDPEQTFTPDYCVAVYGRDISEFCAARRDYIGSALKNCAARIAPSRTAAELAAQIYPGNYRIFEHGIRAASPPPPNPRIAAGGGIRFGYCGTMIPQKGWHLLFEAFVLSKNEMPDAELHFYGGVPEDPRFSVERVTFHPPYARPDLQRILAGIDVGVVPSVFAETFCLVLSEYWQARKPVAVSDIGALKERVTEGANGKKFAPGNIRKIAETLIWFNTNRSWASWNMPVPRSLEAMNAEYKNLYRELIKAAG